MKTPSVLIVMLNWNGYVDTIAAVDSVMQMDYPSFQVVIIDNASTDDSVTELRKIISDRVELVENLENVGYTGGCNIGMRRALEMGVDYVWLLNNDTVVPAGTLSSLIRTAEGDSRIGLVTPMTASIGDSSSITFAGGTIWTEARRYDETNDLEEAQRWEIAYPGKALALGTAMLIRASLIREIGLFDERFFAYFEDIDYSARSIAAGYRNVVDRSAVVRHVQKSREDRPLEIRPHYWYYMTRNESRFWRKHVGLRRSLRPTVGAMLRSLKSLNACKEQPASTQAILAGMWHGWRDRSGPYQPDYRMPHAVASLVRAVAKHPRFKVQTQA